MTLTYDSIVIGAGLAGLAAAKELATAKQRVLLLESAAQVGGRTSNWTQNGMNVESGIHKFIGVYSELKKLIRWSGQSLKSVFYYQDRLEMRVASGGDRNSDPQRRRRSGWFGMSLFRRPKETLRGLFGNSDLLSWREKWQLLRVMRKGIGLLLRDPEKLDTYSIAAFAKLHGASDNLVNTIFWSFSAGLFFLPPEQYGAYPFFSLLWESTKRSYATRLAIFQGGMTDVMAGPIAAALERHGVHIQFQAPAERIVIENGRVVGVHSATGFHLAPRVVVATTIAPAKKIIAASLPGGATEDAELQKLLTLPDMSGVAVQLELEVPTEIDDHIIFGPNSILGTFGEQSNVTFRGSAGRLSTFLSPSEPFMGQSDEHVVSAVVSDLLRQGVDVVHRVRKSAVIRHPSEFYLLAPGSEAKRPKQQTSIPGLALAGDYTKQPFICTMEGAVRSGQLAVKALADQN